MVSSVLNLGCAIAKALAMKYLSSVKPSHMTLDYFLFTRLTDCEVAVYLHRTKTKYKLNETVVCGVDT